MNSEQKKMWVSLLVNIGIPAVILTRFSGEDYLGPVYGLAAAVMFPFIYGFYGLIKNRKVDFVAIIGLAGVLLTGGIGLLRLDPKWLAVKEALVPLIIGVVFLASDKTKHPIVQTLLNKVIDKDKIDILLTPDMRIKYDHRLKITTYIIASSFVLSAVLNYTLARLLVKSQPGTEAFNAELGRMTALSYPVIVVPSLIVLAAAVVYLISGIEKFTEIEVDEILKLHS